MIRITAHNIAVLASKAFMVLHTFVHMQRDRSACVEKGKTELQTLPTSSLLHTGTVEVGMNVRLLSLESYRNCQWRGFQTLYGNPISTLFQAY